MNSKCFMHKNSGSCTANLKDTYVRKYHNEKVNEQCPFFKTFENQRAIERDLEYRAALKGFIYKTVTGE